MTGLAGRSVRLAILFALLLMVPPAWANASPALTGQTNVGTLTIEQQQVESTFPGGMRMSIVATTTEPVDRASIRFTVGTRPTYFETTTRFSATSELDLSLDVPLQLLGIPPGVELHYQWQFHTTSGGVIQSDPASADWIDNRFEWQEYRTDEVVVFAYSGDDDLFEQTAQVSQETIDRYQTWLQAPARSEPLRIWLYDSQQDLHGALNPNSRDWIGGVSYSDFSIISGVVPDGDEQGMLRMIPHEVIHQILADATDNPFAIPAAWFDEGLAGYGQPVGTENFDQMVKLALEEDRLPTVRGMMGEWGADPVQARISYAASFSLVSFIVADMGEEAILRLAAAYRAGLSHDDVLITALGVTAEELDEAWRAHLRS